MNATEAIVAPRIGLALGSGSARGLSHIGVIQELLRIGIVPSIVCGTSVGALVGAALACGRTDALGDWFSRMTWREALRYLDLRAVPKGGVGSASKLIEHLREQFGSPRIEELSTTYAAIATDLASGREIWIRSGDLWNAARASMALPGLLSPTQVDGRWVVDGGLVNPVPVSVCRAMGADFIIAVNLNSDISARHQARSRTNNGPLAESNNDTGILDRIASGLRQKTPSQLTQWLEINRGQADDDDSPGIFSVVASAINIMQDRITRSRLAGEPADIVIAPRLSHIGLLDFDAATEAILEGSNAVRQQASHIKDELAWASGA
jgi:NTE family protein